VLRKINCFLVIRFED